MFSIYFVWGYLFVGVYISIVSRQLYSYASGRVDYSGTTFSNSRGRGFFSFWVRFSIPPCGTEETVERVVTIAARGATAAHISSRPRDSG